MHEGGDRRAFLPPHLGQRLARAGVPARYPYADAIDGALLAVRVFGLDDAPARDAIEPALELRHAAWAPVLAALEAEGGSVLDLGPARLIALFPDGAVARAQRAAHAAQLFFAEHRVHPERPVSAAVAIHRGQVAGLHLGDAEQPWYVAAGAALCAVSALAARLGPGQRALSPEAAAAADRDPAHAPYAPAPAPLAALYAPARWSRAADAYRSITALVLETRGWAPDDLQGFHGTLGAALTTYEGVLVRASPTANGTAWLCAFGLALAHEDDPGRAARAALDLVDELGPQLDLRGALCDGVVMCSQLGTARHILDDVVGEPIALGERFAAEAQWGELLVPDALRRRIPGIQALPRGGDSDRALFSLFGQRSASRAVDVIAPLVGRDREIAVLHDALHTALDGRGGAIGIEGEAGVGKSRLKHEATHMATPLGYAVHRAHASAIDASPYGVVRQLLRSLLGLADETGREAALERVRAECHGLGLGADARHFVAEILGYRYRDAGLDKLPPKDLRARTMQVLRAFVVAAARERPRLLVLDDLHWADETSLACVPHLAAAAHDSRSLVVLLYRPGYTPPDDVSRLALREIGDSDQTRLLSSLLGAPVDRGVAELAREHAGGNPFYLEELARHLRAAGLVAAHRGRLTLVRAPAPDELPATLEALITAHIDRLSEAAQRVAQVGAVLGRRFPRVLLAGFPELRAELDAGLAELQTAQVLFGATRVEYVFKHAVTRDVVYGGIARRRRAELHRAAAGAIELSFATERDQHLAVLGHHYEQARDRDRARACYLAAADRAAAHFAHGEAERLYRAYLGLVDVPTSESVAVRNQLATEVLHQSGRNPEALDEHARALDDAQAIGDRVGQGLALRGIAAIRWELGQMDEAQAAGERSLQVLRAAGDRRGEAIAMVTLANVVGDRGDLDGARALYERAVPLHREVGNTGSLSTTLSNLAEIHRLQDRLGDARALYEEALAIAQEAGDQVATGIVLSNLGGVCADMGELAAARTLLSRALSIHREVGARSFESYTLTVLAGLERRTGGALDDIEELLVQAADIARETGSIDMALCLCEHGHLQLARGKPARDLLRAAERLAPPTSLGEGTEFGKAVWRLRRAVDAYEAGIPLVRGERADDLPPGVTERRV